MIQREVQSTIDRIRELIGQRSPKPLDTTTIRTAFQNSHIRVDEAHVRSTANGAQSVEPRIGPADPGLCFGVFVPVLSDGRLMLTVRYRYAPAKWSVEFPRAVGHSGEDGWKALVEQRLLEDARLTCPNIRLLGAVNSEPLFNSANALVFAGEDCQEVDAHAEEDNALLAGALPVTSGCLDQLIRQGTIECGLTLAAVTMYRARAAPGC